MSIVIIKYNAGNIESVNNAMMRLGVKAEITGDHEKIKAADKVIFPGVGEASTTMAYLKREGLDKLIPELKQPVLGICLGLQLMCSYSEENDTPCLGIFDPSLDNQFVYFVHSYYAAVGKDTAAVCNYINPFSAALHRDNFYATQFHPEKSGTVGARILENFLKL